MNSFFSLVTIAARNIRRNVRRTSLCIVAIAIAVFFTIVMQSMTTGMMASMENVVQVFDTGHVSIVSADFEAEKEYYPVQYPIANGGSAAELAASIKALPGVRAVFPRITAYATLQDSTKKHAQLWALDIEAETAANNFNMTDKSNGLVEGRFPSPDTNECAVGTVFAKKTGLGIGDKIPLKTVSSQFSDKMWSPVITGIFEFDYQKYDEDAILVDFSRLQRLLVLGDATQQLYIFADKPSMSEGIAKAVQDILVSRGDASSGDLVHDWRDNYFVAMMRQSTIIYYIIYMVFVIVASFLIVNTVVMIIHERIKEIGMMGSLGMTRTEIVQVFFFEALFLSTLGALAGCALGGIVTGIGSMFPLDFNAMSGGGMKEFPISGTIYLDFSPAILAGGFVFGVVVASICTLIPSLKSAFVEPVEALRR
ncbi:MAG: lipoprotein-releasing ABC transporter permease subunit [Termitinemataceae bacterium]|nr:MAG: lipoprotein-releasing ABC transporter permease subunit [Termitinemataceae bacterium]